MIVSSAGDQATGGDALLLALAGLIGVALLWVFKVELIKWVGRTIVSAVRGTVRALVAHRLTLAPLYVGVAVVVTVVLLRTYLPGAWWVFVVATLVAAAVIWKFAKSRYDRAWMEADAAVYGTYGVWEMLADVVTGMGLVAGLAMALLGQIPKWLEAYVSGETRIMRRLDSKRWTEMVEAREMRGLKRGKISRTPMGLDVVVTLNGKLTVEGLTSRIRHLETGLGTRRGAIRIETHEMAHKATVRIMTRNPLKKTIQWKQPVGPVSVTEPAQLSMNAFGEWTEIDLCQRILIVGASGAGKSSTQRVLAASVILAVDAELEVWDLKQGTESQHYQGKAALRITNVADCRDRIKELLTTELNRRSAIMQELGTSTWPTSPEHPVRIVMVDEGAALIRGLSDEELDELFTFLEQARAYGIYLWWATQFPKSTNLPTELRSQMSAIIGMKMRRAGESRVVFDDLVKEGWTPHRLPGKGWVMLLDDDHADPTETRVPLLEDTGLRKLTPVVPGRAAVEAGPAREAVTASPQRPAIEAGPPPLDAANFPPQPLNPPTIPPQQDPVSLAKEGQETAPASAPSAPEPVELPTPDAVLTALQQSGTETRSAAQLQLATGRGKSQVYAALQQLQDDGQVVRVGHGRYAVTSKDAGEVSA